MTLAASLGPMLLLWLFIVGVDPWGMLPVHLPIARVPISTNARFSFPALATSKRFNAVVIGTSTARLLRPPVLDAIFGRGTRFENLAMNASTAWEQSEMLRLFARHHPRARAVILDLDASWCQARPGTPRLTGRPFPRWMYGGSRWRGYLLMFNLYALEQASNQFAVAAGWKRDQYGRDGYTDFLPPDRDYDPRRVAALFRRWGPPSTAKADAGPVRLPFVASLPTLLATLPPSATKVLLLPPITIETMGVPGSAVHAAWESCTQQAAVEARHIPGAIVVDFAIPDRVTLEHVHFWDPLHYRVGVANQVMRDLAFALAHHPAPDGLEHVLATGPSAP